MHQTASKTRFRPCVQAESWLSGRFSRCSQLVSIRSSTIKKGFITLIQPDTRMRGSEAYAPLSFALYGPLNGQKAMAEVLRSHLWPVRELVEELPEKLPAGDYLLAVYTPDKACIHVDYSG